MSEYKETYVGPIPEEWKMAPLDEFTGFITKGTTPTTHGYDWANNGVTFLRSECVAEDGLYLEPSKQISQEAHEAYRRSEVQSGDLLMTITGNVGRTIQLDEDFGVGNINQHIARIRVTDERLDRRFAHYFLSQPKIRSYYESITTGQAYPQIGLKQVRKTEIALPPVEEQRAIAEVLTKVDELITSLDTLIEKKRGVKKGAMHRLLNREGRLPGFDGEWKVKSLGEIGTFSKGSGIRRNELVEDGVPCVRYGELYTHHEDKIEEFVSYAPRHIAEQAERLKQGDLLFTASGETKKEIGMCAAYLKDREAYAGGDLIVLRPESECSEFLGYALNGAEAVNQKASMAQGDAVVHIRPRDLAELTVSLPPLDEQRAIAEVLSDMDDEIAALKKRRNKTMAVKKGMMQELLTGKTRLLEEPASASLPS